MRWQIHTDGFITRVEAPPVLPSNETLAKCRAGITREIRNAEKESDRIKLTCIRNDIDRLMNIA